MLKRKDGFNVIPQLQLIDFGYSTRIEKGKKLQVLNASS